MSNQTKHTPGPWMIGYGGNESDEYAVITSPHQEHAICDLNPQGYNKANAALIAAAPELLEALKIAANYIPKDGDQDRDALELCEDAIAKAEGRQ